MKRRMILIILALCLALSLNVNAACKHSYTNKYKLVKNYSSTRKHKVKRYCKKCRKYITQKSLHKYKKIKQISNKDKTFHIKIWKCSVKGCGCTLITFEKHKKYDKYTNGEHYWKCKLCNYSEKVTGEQSAGK